MGIRDLNDSNPDQIRDPSREYPWPKVPIRDPYVIRPATNRRIRRIGSPRSPSGSSTRVNSSIPRTQIYSCPTSIPGQWHGDTQSCMMQTEGGGSRGGGHGDGVEARVEVGVMVDGDGGGGGSGVGGGGVGDGGGGGVSRRCRLHQRATHRVNASSSRHPSSLHPHHHSIPVVVVVRESWSSGSRGRGRPESWSWSSRVGAVKSSVAAVTETAASPALSQGTILTPEAT
ncbi:hypothetical protein BDZ89DRAFT_1111628 [Hymenopellis radicata]|nr:hypothetical protein BDZ89DRAFT_1111628 [Hymenopellis radicata]